MCRAVTCRVCGKTTWDGCGQHIADVKRTVIASQWCDGRHTSAQIAATASARPGIFARIFRR